MPCLTLYTCVHRSVLPYAHTHAPHTYIHTCMSTTITNSEWVIVLCVEQMINSVETTSAYLGIPKSLTVVD